jgi:hypothetical protein
MDTEQQRPRRNHAQLHEFQNKFEALVEVYDWVDGLVCTIVFDYPDGGRPAVSYTEQGYEGCVYGAYHALKDTQGRELCNRIATFAAGVPPTSDKKRVNYC